MPLRILDEKVEPEGKIVTPYSELEETPDLEEEKIVTQPFEPKLEPNEAEVAELESKELYQLLLELAKLPQKILMVIQYHSGDITLVEERPPFNGFNLEYIQQLQERVRESDLI